MAHTPGPARRARSRRPVLRSRVRSALAPLASRRRRSQHRVRRKKRKGVQRLCRTSTQPAQGLELIFRSDPSILDGRFANNGWLQELPKPITKLTWDNAVLLSPATAARLKIGGEPAMQGGEHGQITSDVVELRYKGRAVRGAAFVVVGHPDDAVTIHLGYGRTRAGRVAEGAGFNANALRTSDAMDFGGGLEVVPTGTTYPLACTQYHHLMEGRSRSRGHARRVRQGSEIGSRARRNAAEDAHAVSRLQVRRLQVGHGDRRQRVHRLQRLHGRLPVGEQHSGRRQGTGAARPRDALAPGRHVLSRADATTRRRTSSRCRACTARTRRARSSARSARPCTATKG